MCRGVISIYFAFRFTGDGHFIERDAAQAPPVVIALIARYYLPVVALRAVFGALTLPAPFE
jgi:hypothetical protein